MRTNFLEEKWSVARLGKIHVAGARRSRCAVGGARPFLGVLSVLALQRSL